MKEKIAETLYTIFEQELGACGQREAFVSGYLNTRATDFTLSVRGKKTVRFIRTPLGLGEVTRASDEPKRAAANAAIKHLARWIVSIPPLERKAWCEGELEWPGIAQPPQPLEPEDTPCCLNAV